MNWWCNCTKIGMESPRKRAHISWLVVQQYCPEKLIFVQRFIRSFLISKLINTLDFSTVLGQLVLLKSTHHQMMTRVPSSYIHKVRKGQLISKANFEVFI